jgi:glycosyltransferase involved in cell wall biosynthesis
MSGMAEMAEIVGSETPKKIKILFYATHPSQPIGYGKIGNTVSNFLAAQNDVELYYFAISNFPGQTDDTRFIDPNIKFIDALAEDIAIGSNELYGVDIIDRVMREIKPDVFIIYNDIVVTSRLLNALLKYREEFKDVTRFVSYVDLVYPFEKLRYIRHIDRNVDYFFAFSDFWKKNLIDMGIREDKVGIFYHGFDKHKFQIIPSDVAKKHFGFNEDDFVILNTNRNTYRKAHDISVKAFLELLRREKMDPRIKLFINHQMDSPSGYNIYDLLEVECLKLGLVYDDVLNKHVFMFKNKVGHAEDSEINMLYNAADVGMNTCLGEGFGLCSMEHAALGKPQVISSVGALTDIFKNGGSVLIKPKVVLSVANHVDDHNGDLHICDYNEFADALQMYFHNPSKRKVDGYDIREHILNTYNWNTILPGFLKDLKKIL